MSLGNVLAAREGDEPISFLNDGDQAMYKALKGPAFEVQARYEPCLLIRQITRESEQQTLLSPNLCSNMRLAY